MSQTIDEEPELDINNACRLCLGREEHAEMIPIEKQNLQTCGINLSDNPDLPTQMCTNCQAILQFIHKFRKMCENSDVYLREYCCKQNAVAKSPTPITIQIKHTPSQKEEILIPDELESMESFQDQGEYQDIQAEEIAKEEEVEADDDAGEYLYEIEENENEEGHHIVNVVEGTETENEQENDETADEMWIEETCEDDVSDATIYIVDDSSSVDVKAIRMQRAKKNKLLRPMKEGKAVIGNRKEKANSMDRHVCEICGNCYKRLGALETHRRRHLNQRPFECELCKETFSFNFLLERHMRKHTGDRPFTCEYCDRKFVDRSTMSRHQKIHRNERAYKCDTCGKSFTYYSVLKTHIMSHTGEKPYSCGICGKGFHRASDLKNHLETLQHRKDPRAAVLLADMKRRNS